jgi:curved DNA-binding protein CbpA
MTLNVPDFDLYDELELAPHASLVAIHAVYRALSKQHHPDTALNRSAAEAKMKRINQAHDILKDAASRAAYDQLRLQPGAGTRTSQPPRRPSETQHGRPGALRCSKCGKAFKTQNGLDWHRANNRNCSPK